MENLQCGQRVGEGRADRGEDFFTAAADSSEATNSIFRGAGINRRACTLSPAKGNRSPSSTLAGCYPQLGSRRRPQAGGGSLGDVDESRARPRRSPSSQDYWTGQRAVT